jgi:hypothetical protein
MTYKSKTLATWIAVAGGTLGLHRFYLHGFRDVAGWLHPCPTMLGLIGLQRLREFGQDDRLAWALLPLLGLMISIAMLSAILMGLTPDERWNARHNPNGPAHRSSGLTVFGVVVALGIGAIALMATVAYGAQHLFEWLIYPAAAG